MNVSEITASLTDCFAKHQSKTVTRVVCIDYIPLAVYKNNMEHVCVLESHDGSDCEIVFKAHYSSDKAITGLLRDGNWGISKVLEMLDKDYNYALVLENEKLVGIVTKSDLINKCY